MGIDQQPSVIIVHDGVTGEMDLLNKCGGHGGDIGVRIEAVILRADVDIVDVEQDAAAAALCNGDEKIPFAHRRIDELQIARYILDENLPLQAILHAADARSRLLQRFGGIGQGQQVVEVLAAGEAFGERNADMQQWVARKLLNELGDPDEDGMLTWREFLANTDPKDPLSLLQFEHVAPGPAAGDMVLRWQSASNRLYSIWRSASLPDGFAHRIVTNLPATLPVNSYTDTVDNAEALFYRIEVHPTDDPD